MKHYEIQISAVKATTRPTQSPLLVVALVQEAAGLYHQRNSLLSTHSLVAALLSCLVLRWIPWVQVRVAHCQQHLNLTGEGLGAATTTI